MNKRTRNTTLIKYFFSYFIPIVLLLTGFLFISKFQFEKKYSESLRLSVMDEITAISNSLDNEIFNLHQIQYYLAIDKTLFQYRQMDSSYNRVRVEERLSEYIATNNFLSAICYVGLTNDQLICSGLPIFETDTNLFKIYYNEEWITFPLSSYLHDPMETHLVHVEAKGQELVIYIPKRSNDEYCIFYILSTTELHRILTPSSNIISLCLLNSENSIITGFAPDILYKYIEALPLVDNYYDIDSEQILYMTETKMISGSLAAIISNREIVSHVGNALTGTYILLTALSAIGLIMIVLAMRTTFLPLHKLTRKLVSSTDTNQSYTRLLENVFYEISSEKQSLQEKLNSYRAFVQKSLLDSVISNTTFGVNDNIDLDILFDKQTVQHIYIIKIHGDETSDFRRLQRTLTNTLPNYEYARIIAIEYGENYVVFLLCYTHTSNIDFHAIYEYFCRLHIEGGYRTAISNEGTSPLEIPSLYQNVFSISEQLSNLSVVAYTETPCKTKKSDDFEYPFEQLETFLHNLRGYQFTKAKEILLYLLERLDFVAKSEGSFADFFIRCVLIDILTTLANTINEMNLKFQNYSELYFSAYYLCRSCSYKECQSEIHEKLLELFKVCEEAAYNSSVNASLMEEVMNREYASPDFSITVLADIFHVSSVPYMSLLFKKNFGINFSDYLWNMRLEKAKSLLRNTNLSIDEISVKVGYLTSSSFRRKFKAETGVTPSQYRDGEETDPG